MSDTEQSNVEQVAAQTGTNVVVLPGKTRELRPTERVVAFAKAHPFITVAGGIAVGAAVSALLPRGVKRRASGNLLGKVASLAESAGAASLLFGRQASEHAEDFGKDARKQASKFARHAEKLGDVAGNKIEKYGHAAVTSAGAFSRATAHRAADFGSAAAKSATQLGQAAAAQGPRIKNLANDLKHRLKP